VSWFKATGPLSEEAANSIDFQASVFSSNKTFSFKLDDVNAVLEDLLGNYLIIVIDEVGIDAMIPIVKNITACSVEVIAKIVVFVCEHDSQNDAADSMPPVLPHQLVKLRGQVFAMVVQLQYD
jgi:hypothetical protein